MEQQLQYVPFRLAQNKGERCTCVALGKMGDPPQLYVFTGTDDGYVNVYRKPGWCVETELDLEPGWDRRAANEDPPENLTRRSCLSVSKRPILQICVDEDLKRLFTLSDGVVHMLKLESAREQVSVVTPLYEEKKNVLKRVTAMCVGTHNGVYSIVVAVKNKVHVFRYTREAIHTTGEGVTQIQLDRPTETIRLALVEELLITATKAEYRFVNVTVGGGSASLDRKSFSGPPLVLPLTVGGEAKVLVQLAKQSIVYDVATAQKEDVIAWQEVPVFLMFVKPFHIVGVSADGDISICSYFRPEETVDGMEERDYIPREKVRGTVDLGSIKNVSSKVLGCSSAAGLGVLVSSGHIYELVPVSFLGQLLALVRSGCKGTLDVDLAVLLLRNHQPPLMIDEELKVECVISREAGIAKFNSGDFVSAFLLLEKMHDIDPELFDARCIIRAFDLSESTLKRYMHTTVDPPLGQPERVSEIINIASRAGLKLVQEARQELYNFLKHIRTLHHDPYEDVPDLHRCIDTALLLLYLDIYGSKSQSEESDQEVWEILQHGNCLEFEVCKDELARDGKYRCLALLKAHHGEVEEALRMLKELGTEGGEFQEDGQDGVRETVLALQHCNEEENYLVMEYLPWVLDRDPMEAVQALLIPREQPLDTEAVMALLESYPDDIIMQYLEHIILYEQNKDKKYHTQLALIYINAIKKLAPLCPTFSSIKGGREAGLLGSLRRRLQNLLMFQKYYEPVRYYYDPIKVVSNLHGSGLHEELVITYSYMGDHEAAIELILYEQKDLPAAVTYGIEQYQRALKKHLLSIFHKVFGNKDLPSSPSGGGGSPVTSSAPADYSTDWPMSATQDDEFGTESVFLEQAVARPDEFFSKYAGELQDVDVVRDKHGNVFAGIHKHNTYMLEVVKQCLYPPAKEQSIHKMCDIIQLLEEHSKDLDPQLVLKVITQGGADLPVTSLHRYLQQVFLRMASERKEVVLLKEVSKANLHKHKVDRAVLLGRNVLVDQERQCDICQKRLGIESLTVVYPNLKIAHNRCMGTNTHKDPATGERFWVDMHQVHPWKKYYQG